MPVAAPVRIAKEDLGRYIGQSVYIKIKDAAPLSHVVGTLDAYDNNNDIMLTKGKTCDGTRFKELVIFGRVVDYIETR